MAIKVTLAGATGWAGSELARAIAKTSDLKLVAAIARKTAGRSLGEVLGEPLLSGRIHASAAEAFGDPCDVPDFATNPDGELHATVYFYKRMTPDPHTIPRWLGERDCGISTEGLSMKPEDVVQRQVLAYNARDLPGFLAEYHDDVKIFRPPATEPVMSGKPALAEFYATERFNRPALHAEIVNRIAFGNKVIDHERITGVLPQPFEVAAVYLVVDGLIKMAWFHSAD